MATLCLMMVDAHGEMWSVKFITNWQDLHDDDKTCMQSSYWEIILENGQW
jgi:hypothetical protein